MGKKKIKHTTAVSSSAQATTKAPLKEKQNFFNNFKIQALLLIIIGLISFANSFNNDYALDDGLVIKKNEYVQQGFSGIPKILSSDALESFSDQMHNEQGLSGGRYRPLSIVTFAIEQQLFGSTDETSSLSELVKIRHIINVLLYILSVILLLYFLRNFIFKQKRLIAFIASLLFLIHPIHTEVVANIKSRDEILSFLFIILTFIYVFRFADTKKIQQLILGLLFYLLALLSKEYAITLLVFIPMLLYIVKGDTIKKSFIKTIPFLGVAILYIVIRIAAAGLGSPTAENTEILNNPFLYATTPEKWATRIDILNHYFRLLFYPTPLSSDYSYNTIPYTNFGNSLVWLSIAIHLSIMAAMIILFVRRNILSFALAFYLLNLFLISNLFFDIGATMGERLIYHSSLGFVIAIAILAEFLLQQLRYPSTLAIIIGSVVGCLITVWCTIKDRERSRQWKDDTTLFFTDVKTVPNSILANGNTGYAYNNLSLLPENKDRSEILADSARVYLTKAVSIDTKYVNGYLQLGLSYALLKEYDSAVKNLDIARSLYPNNPDIKPMYTNVASLCNNRGISLANTQPEEAFKLFQKAVSIAPDNISCLNDLASAYYYFYKDFDNAGQLWKKVLLLDPANKTALNGIALITKK